MQWDAIKERLAALDVSSLADTDKSMRVLDPEIRPLRTGLKLIGRARTVRCFDDFLTIIQAIEEASPDEALIIDSQGSRTAMFGELLSLEASRRGLAGLVVDGVCRDSRTLRSLDIPVYSRGVTAAAGTANRLGETQIEIQCGGVAVNPGDIVFGDDDGLIVISPDEAAKRIPAAEKIQRVEIEILSRLNAGRDFFEMLNYHEHVERLRAGADSKLTFIV